MTSLARNPGGIFVLVVEPDGLPIGLGFWREPQDLEAYIRDGVILEFYIRETSFLSLSLSIA